MSDCPNEISQESADKKGARRCARFWTTIYAVSFPFLAVISPLTAAIKPSSFQGPWRTFFALVLPLTLPASIDLMWSSYMSEKYNRVFVFWMLPWVAWCLIGIVDESIRIAGAHP
jgi:hypothetical protein